MGLFGKKEIKKQDNNSLPDIPDLPSLPDLPTLTDLEDFNEIKTLPQLPNISKSLTDDKFSQKAIKEAVSGEKEEYGKRVSGEIREPFHKELSNEEFKRYSKEPIIEKREISIPKEFISMPKKSKNNEPVFVRLDKFQESLELFESAKQKINEMERLLRNIKDLKTQEELELDSWESEIETIKSQIDRLDKDVFSKIE